MEKHLLYMEDDESLAQVTSKAFVRRGFQVSHFYSLRQLRDSGHDSEFSHALLDMKLEDGNSLELIGQLSKKNKQLKIVLLTGYASIATAVQAMKLGACNYLPKPSSIDEILKAFDEEVDLDSPVNLSDDNYQTMSLKRLEWETIQKALVENDGNITLTAKQLNMHRRTLQRKLNKRPSAK